MTILSQVTYPSMGVDIPISGVSRGGFWVNPGNLNAQDNVGASCAYTIGGTGHTQTDLLVASNCGFTIPDNATIVGVQVDVRKKSTLPNQVGDNLITLGGDDLSDFTIKWPTTFGISTYGGPSELWGLALTPADVNDPNFSFTLQARRVTVAQSPLINVDTVKITVFYQVSSPNIICKLFKVLLNQTYLDLNPLTGLPMQPSKQRTMLNTGKNLLYREAPDGFLFQDCNYWDRFTEPVDTKFIDIVLEADSPYVLSGYTVLDSDTFDTNFINTCVANFVQISNTGVQDASIQINDSSTAILILKGGTTQVLKNLSITKLAFAGNGVGTTLEMIFSLGLPCIS